MTPEKVHLVGSIGLDSVEEIFRTVGTMFDAGKTASRHLNDFGIATECGMARARTPELVRSLLQVHADVSREPSR